ncbi:MAG: helix-turn-helix transcriptional regulator [Ekhidna sp.]|nr:helix-turn-helix transcriptional regulator [Ekhidna sp.]
MIHVSYELDHAPQIFKQLSQQLDYHMEGGVYVHKSELAFSRIKPIQFTDSTSCMVSKFALTESARVERLKNDKDLLIFDFHFSESAPLSFPGGTGPSHLIYGVFLSTDLVHSYADFHGKETYRQVAVFIDREEVLNIVDERNSRLKGLLKDRSAFHLFREISHKLAREVEELQQSALETDVSNSMLHGMVLKIISLCLAEFKVEKLPVKLSLEKDLHEIMETTNYIEGHVDESITLDMLVAQTNMSSSKYRREFKVVYGISPMQYVKQKKLWKAKQLMELGESVAQAAYAVGYTNLSYFTRSFKAQFFMNPKDYKKFVSSNQVL